MFRPWLLSGPRHACELWASDRDRQHPSSSTVGKVLGHLWLHLIKGHLRDRGASVGKCSPGPGALGNRMGMDGLD